MRSFFYSTIIFTMLNGANCHALDYWNLPAKLDDSNTKIEFAVDSTWHMVHGDTSKIEGEAALHDRANFKAVVAEIRLPVKAFNTKRESRDERMREVMDAPEFPYVTFRINELLEACNPDKLELNQECDVTIDGSITIRDVTKKQKVKARALRSARGYEIKGNMSLNWLEYGVEDPSILVAKVDPMVNITFAVVLPDKNDGENKNARY